VHEGSGVGVPESPAGDDTESERTREEEARALTRESLDIGRDAVDAALVQTLRELAGLVGGLADQVCDHAVSRRVAARNSIELRADVADSLGETSGLLVTLLVDLILRGAGETGDFVLGGVCGRARFVSSRVRHRF